MILGSNTFEIRVFDPNTTQLVKIIPPQMITGLKFKRVFSDVGQFSLTMPFNQEIWDLYQLDLLLSVYTMNYSTGLLEKEKTFFVRGREVYYEGVVKQMAFFGVSLEHLVYRRVIKPTNDDDTNAGGFVTRADLAGLVLEQFFDEQIVNPDDASRKFPNVVLTKLDNGVDSVGVRVRYSPLVETINVIRDKSDIDYSIEWDQDNGNIEIIVGTISNDYTYEANYPDDFFLLFSPLYGNTINPTLRVDRGNEKTAIFVLGEGEGVNQQLLEIPTTRQVDSLYNRIEDVVGSKTASNSNSSSLQQALAKGTKKINDTKPTTKFDFQVVDNRVGYRFGVDYDVGDRVSFFWENEVVNFRVLSTTFTASGNRVTRDIQLEVYT